MKKIYFTFIFIPLLAGCAQIDRISNQALDQKAQEETKAQAIIKCQELCQSQAGVNGNRASGPCLANQIVPGWSCDLVHKPRIEADNDPKNQCEDYRLGKVLHFVEVDGNCNLIKAQ